MHLTFLLMMALATEHPLDPLNAQEIEFSAQLLRASPQFQKDASFSTIVLKEPPKEEVLRYTAGSPMPRQAFSVILDRTGNRTFEAVVDLTTKQIVSWKEVKGVQPGVLDSDYDDLDRIVKENPQWQEAMRKRGIDDFDSVQIQKRCIAHARATAINVIGEQGDCLLEPRIVAARIHGSAARLHSAADGFDLIAPSSQGDMKIFAIETCRGGLFLPKRAAPA